jgi:RHS repeat-associated protein
LTTWGGSTLSYDANGNLTGSGASTYSWNTRNQLIATSDGSGIFAYDPLGRRANRTVSGVATPYVHDGLNPATVGGTSILAGQGLDEFYAEADASATTSYISDGIGSTVAASNSSSTIVGNNSYGPYGSTTQSGSTATAFQYTGRENDGASNLYFYRNRYYSPTLDRFISQDPIGLAGGANLYAYARGNPISWRDPSGLDVTITITRQGISSTGLSIPGTINAMSTVTPLLPIDASTIENAQAGDNSNKPPIPAGSYDAYIRTDHKPNRIELRNVPGYTNIQIHPGSYPRNFKGCFGAGSSSSLDFLGGTVATQNRILSLIAADGSGNITVNVSPIPLGPVLPAAPSPFGFPSP